MIYESYIFTDNKNLYTFIPIKYKLKAKKYKIIFISANT